MALQLWVNSRFGPGDVLGHETSPSPLIALAKRCMTQQNKRCTVKKKKKKSDTQNGRLQLAGKALGVLRCKSGLRIAPALRAVPEPRRGSGVSVWAAADALCSFISYKHCVGRKEASAPHPPLGASRRG